MLFIFIEKTLIMGDTNSTPVPEETPEIVPELETVETPEPIVETPVEESIVSEPVVEEAPAVIPEATIEPEPIPDAPEDAIPVDEAHNTEPKENPELYTVQVADLNAYPELSQQGVQLYDQVPYGSLYVWKNATATGDSVVQDLWPRSTGNEKPKGLTFKG